MRQLVTFALKNQTVVIVKNNNLSACGFFFFAFTCIHDYSNARYAIKCVRKETVVVQACPLLLLILCYAVQYHDL